MGNALAKVFASNVRAELFRLLFGYGEVELHMREMARQTGLAIGTIQQDLKQLSSLELVRSRRDGNRLYYGANRDHPLYADIHSMVTKTTGLIPLLADALSDESIVCAFIFGSFARREEKAGSDLDLMVIGKLGLRKLASLLSEQAQKSGREINPHVLSPEEFKKRRDAKDHFLTSVLADRKIFIIGNENELTAMGQ